MNLRLHQRLKLLEAKRTRTTPPDPAEAYLEALTMNDLKSIELVSHISALIANATCDHGPAHVCDNCLLNDAAIQAAWTLYSDRIHVLLQSQPSTKGETP